LVQERIIKADLIEVSKEVHNAFWILLKLNKIKELLNRVMKCLLLMKKEENYRRVKRYSQTTEE
jgi:hypothetical protein